MDHTSTPKQGSLINHPLCPQPWEGPKDHIVIPPGCKGVPRIPPYKAFTSFRPCKVHRGYCVGTHLSHARNIRGQKPSTDHLTQKRATQKMAMPQNNPILPSPASTWDWLVLLIHFETWGLHGYRVPELSEVRGPHSRPIHRSLTPCQGLSSVPQHCRGIPSGYGTEPLSQSQRACWRGVGLG